MNKLSMPLGFEIHSPIPTTNFYYKPIVSPSIFSLLDIQYLKHIMSSFENVPIVPTPSWLELIQQRLDERDRREIEPFRDLMASNNSLREQLGHAQHNVTEMEETVKRLQRQVQDLTRSLAESQRKVQANHRRDDEQMEVKLWQEERSRLYNQLAELTAQVQLQEQTLAQRDQLWERHIYE